MSRSRLRLAGRCVVVAATVVVCFLAGGLGLAIPIGVAVAIAVLAETRSTTWGCGRRESTGAEPRP